MVRMAVLDAPESIRLAEMPSHALGASDVRIRVLGCGICGSDVTSYFTGAYVRPGQVMGHEFVGRVIDAGADLPTTIPVGTLVAVRPMRSCGTCWYCSRGDIHLCAGTPTRSLSFGLPGGYADEVHIPHASWGIDVIPIGDVDPADGIWIEPLAVAQHAVARADLPGSSRVIVIGAGSIGLSLGAMARRSGAEVHVVEPRAARRAAVVAIGLGNAYASAEELPRDGVDAVFDSSGSAAALRAVVTGLPPSAPVILVGVTGDALPDLGERPLIGAFGYTEDDFLVASCAVSTGDVRLGRAVTHRFPLHQLADAMTAVRQDDDAVKVMITP